MAEQGLASSGFSQSFLILVQLIKTFPSLFYPHEGHLIPRAPIASWRHGEVSGHDPIG